MWNGIQAQTYGGGPYHVSGRVISGCTCISPHGRFHRPRKRTHFEAGCCNVNVHSKMLANLHSIYNKSNRAEAWWMLHDAAHQIMLCVLDHVRTTMFHLRSEAPQNFCCVVLMCGIVGAVIIYRTRLLSVCDVNRCCCHPP